MENKKDLTEEFFRIIVDFVYEELLHQYINQKGNCKASTFWLINWNIIIDKKNDGWFILQYFQ